MAFSCVRVSLGRKFTMVIFLSVYTYNAYFDFDCFFSIFRYLLFALGFTNDVISLPVNVYSKVALIITRIIEMKHMTNTNDIKKCSRSVCRSRWWWKMHQVVSSRINKYGPVDNSVSSFFSVTVHAIRRKRLEYQHQSLKR